MTTIRELIARIASEHPEPALGSTLRRAHTGRFSEALTAEQQVSEALVRKWLKGDNDEAAAIGRKLIAELLTRVPIRGFPTALRARPFIDSGSAPTSPLEFGPNPLARANRYNGDGQVTLYLGESEPSLRAEMLNNMEPGEVPYFARYNLPPPMMLCLADLSDPTLDNAIQLACDVSEMPDKDYAPGQRLADLVRESGFDGMIVPGVRGSKSHHYKNAAIFECGDWQNWLDLSFSPRLLDLDGV